MKEVLVLGSGNAFSTSGRANAAFWISATTGGALLLDCGVTTLYRMMQEGLSCEDLDAILLTHFHGDHFGGLPFLFLQMQLIEGRTRPLLLAGPSGVEKKVRELCELLYPGFVFGIDINFLEICPGARVRIVCENSSFLVEALEMDHRPESLGYRIFEGKKGLSFTGDTGWTPKIERLCSGMDLALVELSLLERPGNPVAHLSLPELLEKGFHERAGARRLVFTHVYDELAREARRHGFEIAEDGMRISL